MFERLKRLWKLTDPDQFIVLDEHSFTQEEAQNIAETLKQPVILSPDISHIRTERMAKFIPRIKNDPVKEITQENA